ncbi:MAG: protease inhibitor I42 family protein [Clostridiales bacterium]|nr:protease inhibitor I42 family protein [Clostridiales bacterium]
MKKGLALLLACAVLSLGVAVAETPAAQHYTVTFLENPTTGYTWSFGVSDATILTVTDNGFTAAANPDGAEGVGGTHSWTMTGLAEGDATVTFTLGQGWEGGETTDSIVYTLHADADKMLTLKGVVGIPELYTPGETAVVLTENPTTGYQWAYQASAEGILTPGRDAYLTPDELHPETEPLMGEGGVHVWSFSGAAQGDVTLTFSYARSWEAGVEPEATVTYTYHVDQDLNVTMTEIGGDYEAYDPLLGEAEAE